MNLFKWISNSIIKNRNNLVKHAHKNYKHRHKTINKKRNHIAASRKSNTLADYDNKKIATVNVYFVDFENHLFLDTPKKLQGHVGQHINLSIPNFKNYIMEYIHGFNSIFTNDNQNITICYRLRNAAPIAIYYVDFDTYNILKCPDYLFGTWGSKYHVSAHKIDGYKLHTYTGWPSGLFNDVSDNVIFYYRNANWQNVKLVNYFVRLNLYTNVYNNPSGNVLRTKLPANSTWKVFLEIKTFNETWLNLGGNQWIQNKNLIKYKKYPQNKITNKKS
ncbi:MucBP domain-containing protein [Apilactobacillus xinyiensis]|uniref:MucBP domain-containing protein n=1 Tax=Apilactobacillus xinyiensis TaxID=2841032 RepID=UPI00200CD17A|nr:MucBP domain-containing protein [Apilactobacillus xinyiensis]MCL0329723.1 MucBP domain-containing protein [Apilactobacillus xinyiensis]